MILREQVLDESFDCICGLAYPMMSNTGDKLGPPLFDSLIQQKLLAQNVFAFYMSLCAEEQKSELAFGWYDEQRYTGPIVWHPVVHKYFWSLKLEDIKVSVLPSF